MYFLHASNSIIWREGCKGSSDGWQQQMAAAVASSINRAAYSHEGQGIAQQQ
jgi:hypothetical protein